jgi:hypothetical protein
MNLRRIGPLLVAWAGLCSGPAWSQAWVESVFPERAADFGTVARGSEVRRTFRVTNLTGREVRIADVRTKCGCTGVRVGARSVPPGTQTTVEATVDTANLQGYKTTGLTLVLDRPEPVEVELRLTGFIRGDVILEPGLVDFGSVPHRAGGSLTLTLAYAGGRPDWAVTGVQAASKFVTAWWEEVSRLPGGYAEYQLTAMLAAEAPAGHIRDEIILLTNDRAVSRIPIAVSADVRPVVTVAPSPLLFGQVEAGQLVEKAVLVRAARPFKLNGFRVQMPELTATSTEDGPKSLHPVKVRLKAPVQPGPYHATIEIDTDIEGEPPARLTAFATVIPG